MGFVITLKSWEIGSLCSIVEIVEWKSIITQSRHPKRTEPTYLTTYTHHAMISDDSTLVSFADVKGMHIHNHICVLMWVWQVHFLAAAFLDLREPTPPALDPLSHAHREKLPGQKTTPPYRRFPQVMAELSLQIPFIMD